MKRGCKCVHKEQDRLHGKGVRVANPTQAIKSDGSAYTRCTVCGSIN